MSVREASMGDIIRLGSVPMRLAAEVVGTAPVERLDVLHGVNVVQTARSGLRKFTGAKRAKRLPASVNFPCHTVSRPRPRYSAPCQATRTRRRHRHLAR